MKMKINEKNNHQQLSDRNSLLYIMVSLPVLLVTSAQYGKRSNIMMDRARGFVPIMFVMWLLKSARKVISVKLEHEQRTISAHSNKIPIILYDVSLM